MFRTGIRLKVSGLNSSSLFWGVNASLHAMNFYRNLCLTKFVLLPWNFLSLRNLASHYMLRTSKEILIL